jgi:hypothetical protein
MNLYRLDDGTLGVVEGEGHAFEDPAILPACTEAIQHMRAGNKGEWVDIDNGQTPPAREVVAYCELEEFVSAA